MNVKRKSPLLIIVLAIAGLLTVIGGVLSNVVSNAIAFLPLQVALPLLALVVVATIAITAWQLRLQEQHPSSSPMDERQRRSRLIAKVRSYWITGVLEHSLHHAALLALGLSEQPDAVINPWSLIVQEAQRPARHLPPDASIIQVYDDAQGELLILGEPGAGKTTLLLELARTLLTRAEKDDASCIPIVLNLSSWSEKRSTLMSWLIEELYVRYQVPRDVSQQWIAQDQLLLLLDGLDEVAPTHLSACVQALNSYRQEHNLAPMVVCCRQSEYLSQKTRVLLHNAVVIQPLTPQQIDEYFSNAQGQLEAVRVALNEDHLLRELATTPLMLNVLVLAYQNTPVESLTTADSLETRRRQVFEKYTERMLNHRGGKVLHSPQRIQPWLTWLAQQMLQHNQAEFSLEQMQPDWIPSVWARRLYRSMLAGSIYGVVIGLLVGLAMYYALMYNTRFMNVIYSGLYGLFLGFLFGVSVERFDEHVSTQQPISLLSRLWMFVSQYMRKLLKNRVVMGMIIGMSVGLFDGQLLGMIYGSAFRYRRGGLLIGLLIGLFVTTCCKLDTAIQPVEIVRWSQATLMRNLNKLPLYLLVVEMTLYILPVLLGISVYPQGIVLQLFSDVALRIVCGFSSASLLLFIVTAGLSSTPIDRRKPGRFHHGLWSSVRISFAVGLSTCLLAIGCFWLSGVNVLIYMDSTVVTSDIFLNCLTYSFAGEVFYCIYMYLRYPGQRNELFNIFFTSLLIILGVWAVYPGAAVLARYLNQMPYNNYFFYSTGILNRWVYSGIITGIFIGLRWGGFSLLQQALLRLFLWRLQCLPLRSTQFLDDAAKRLLLRKVEQRYMFPHRLFLEYFASLKTAYPSAYSFPISRPDDEDAQAYFNRGMTYLEIRDYKQAIAHFDYAIKLGASNSAVYYRRGFAYYMERKNYQQVISDATQALAFDARDPSIYSLRADAYYMNNDYEQAITDYTHAIRLKSKNIAEVYRYRGLAYRKLEQYERAIADYTHAIRLGMGNTAFTYMNRGYVYLQLEQYKRAIADYTHAIRLDANNAAIAYRNRGLAYCRSEQYERAIADYTHAIRLAPSSSAGYHGRGYTYLLMKQRKLACADFQRDAEIAPKNVNTAWKTIYAALGKTYPDSEVIKRLEEIVKLDPECPESHLCRGVVLGLRKQWSEGIQELEQYMQLKPDKEDAYFWKGLFCAYLGRDDEARAAITTALEKYLPPLLLAPLQWLEQDRAEFYQEYALPLLIRYELLTAPDLSSGNQTNS